MPGLFAWFRALKNRLITCWPWRRKPARRLLGAEEVHRLLTVAGATDPHSRNAFALMAAGLRPDELASATHTRVFQDSSGTWRASVYLNDGTTRRRKTRPLYRRDALGEQV